MSAKTRVANGKKRGKRVEKSRESPMTGPGKDGALFQARLETLKYARKATRLARKETDGLFKKPPKQKEVELFDLRKSLPEKAPNSWTSRR